jgi:hypothetical protein
MKNIILLLLLALFTGIAACSKNDKDQPLPEPGQTAGLVKEKEIFFTPHGIEGSYLQQFSYDAAKKVSKTLYTIKLTDGTQIPGSYDSMVYSANQLSKIYGFQYDNNSKKFSLETRQEFQYQNNVLALVNLYLYSNATTSSLIAKNVYKFVNGNETECKTYNQNDVLLNGYNISYQGNKIAERVSFDPHSEPNYKSVYQYTSDTLRLVKEYDIAGSSSMEKINIQYQYKGGKLHKEVYTTLPPFPSDVDSVVYRY